MIDLFEVREVHEVRPEGPSDPRGGPLVCKGEADASADAAGQPAAVSRGGSRRPTNSSLFATGGSRSFCPRGTISAGVASSFGSSPGGGLPPGAALSLPRQQAQQATQRFSTIVRLLLPSRARLPQPLPQLTELSPLS